MGGLHNIRVIFDRRNTASAVRKGSVEIEISYKGQRKRLSTGVNILKQQWKQNEVVDHPDANKLNQQIKQLYNSLQLKMNLLTNKESDVDLSTLTKVRKTNIEGAKSDFLEWVEERILEEMAAETAFEGNRFFDLLRISKHRANHPQFIATKIGRRFDNPAEIESRLKDINNLWIK